MNNGNKNNPFNKKVNTNNIHQNNDALFRSSGNKIISSNKGYLSNQKKMELEKKKELEIQKMKREKELEDDIRDKLKCYICLSKVTKPKMCNFCKRLCCQACINKWLERHSFCGICKHHVTQKDMITVPLLDGMSTFFINSIDNIQKKKKINRPNSKNQNILDFDINTNAIFEDNQEDRLSEIEEYKTLCREHNNKIEYYCINCNKYYCSKCLVFFGEEVNKHSNHFVVQTSKMNDLNINNAINEYKKLPKTKKYISELIGLCNVKIRENQIEKSEAINFLTSIQNAFIKKIDDESKSLKISLNVAKNQKIYIEKYYNLLAKAITKIEPNNKYNKEIIKKIKKNNYFDPNLLQEIQNHSKINLKLFSENYQTDFMEFTIPVSTNGFSEGAELIKFTLRNIPGCLCNLLFKYSNQKIYISFVVYINEPNNSLSFPNFYSYIYFRNNFGIEFINLDQHNQSEAIKEQISSIELDENKFSYLLYNGNKISIKLHVIKTFYK